MISYVREENSAIIESVFCVGRFLSDLILKNELTR